MFPTFAHFFPSLNCLTFNSTVKARVTSPDIHNFKITFLQSVRRMTVYFDEHTSRSFFVGVIALWKNDMSRQVRAGQLSQKRDVEEREETGGKEWRKLRWPPRKRIHCEKSRTWPHKLNYSRPFSFSPTKKLINLETWTYVKRVENMLKYLSPFER